MLLNILDQFLRNNFTRHGPMRNGIVCTDTGGRIDVEGTHTCLLGNFEEVGGIRGVPSTHDEDEVELQLVRFLNKVMDCVLSFLCTKN